MHKIFYSAEGRGNLAKFTLLVNLILESTLEYTFLCCKDYAEEKIKTLTLLDEYSLILFNLKSI